MEKKLLPGDRERTDSVRFGLTLENLRQAFEDQILCMQGRLFMINSTRNDAFMAFAYIVRDRMIKRESESMESDFKKATKAVAYLSAEFLVGPQLGNNLINLGIFDEILNALTAQGYSLNYILGQEHEPGLGNGGLGRLASCYLDSLATLEVPAIGYGIRYEFGIFDQVIKDGWQTEVTDKWLQYGNPWEIPRPELSVNVKFSGHTESYTDEKGCYRVKWVPHHEVRGVAYDMWIPGYHVSNCSLMRLWKAEAAESFDFQAFNHGDYYKAVEDKIYSENITKVLYPNDEKFSGKQLRLSQQYFFVSCSLQDMLDTVASMNRPLDEFHNTWAVQLNDTHPSIAVAELMRLLIDEYSLEWDKAWEITVKTFSYTNHTLMPEALEKWELELFSHILPRHIEIIYEINRRFLGEVRAKFPGDEEKVKRLSIIDETGGRYIRMAHLACVGSHKINGVAELHSELVRDQLLRDFYDIWPEKFLNITNGVTPRRWMLLSNPGMSDLIKETIGKSWITKPEELRKLEPKAKDESFCEKWWKIKRDNKCGLAKLIKKNTGIDVDPDSMFDCQVKRIHEYKRQHLNVLHIITLYNRLRRNPKLETTPRTFIFGGKAAPGYFMAKLIIKLINSVGEVVNSDPVSKDILKVVFFPDFGVKYGQRIYPAADLSEQISTAGLEASGTGNMKFSFNGALTIGTLDGANIEIRQEVGEENFFLFGQTADEVQRLKTEGYTPHDWYVATPELKEAIDLISSGHFSRGDRELFRPLVESLLNHDTFMLLADYQSYIDCQDRVSDAYRDVKHWTEMSIINVARMGKFSSDRSIREYCEKVWGIKLSK